jgi:histidine phosphotransferase ChpT|tara:strand:+ start:142 stop:774 length:633 start_codon:yes stop_codon:yes gene_type:complete
MSEPQLSPRILELLVSHICHDLVSPVGAINNGIEFIEEMGDAVTSDAMGLIGSSVRQASVALQCFRLAYGGAGSGGNVTFEDVKSAFSNYIEGGRTQLQWQVNPKGGQTPAGFMKVVLNALMMADECIPTNGDVIIEDNEDGNGVKITAKAPKVEFRDGVEAAFNHTATLDDLNPRTVHAYVTKVFGDFFNVTVSYDVISDGEVSFKITY